MKLNDKEKNKKKLIITIICMIIFIVVGILFVKNIFSKVMNSNETKYILEINNSNSDKIIKLLKDNDNKYCESMYKIEYTFSFPHYENVKIYCKDEDNIELYNTNQKINDYIVNSGNKINK